MVNFDVLYAIGSKNAPVRSARSIDDDVVVNRNALAVGTPARREAIDIDALPVLGIVQNDYIVIRDVEVRIDAGSASNTTASELQGRTVIARITRKIRAEIPVILRPRCTVPVI